MVTRNNVYYFDYTSLLKRSNTKSRYCTDISIRELKCRSKFVIQLIDGITLRFKTKFHLFHPNMVTIVLTVNVRLNFIYIFFKSLEH